jgi:TPR repeat protein
MAHLWYAKAVEQGDPEAQFNLGVIHSKGEGGLPGI